MIVAIDQFDKSCWLIGNIAARRQIRMKLAFHETATCTQWVAESGCACARHCFCLERCFSSPEWRALSIADSLKTSLIIFAPGSRACAARTALPAAIFPTDIEPTTKYAPDATRYQSTACGGAGGGSFETPVTR